MSAMPTCKHMIKAEDFPKTVMVSVGPPSCPWCEIDRLRTMLRFALDTRMKYLCDNPDCPGCPSWHGKLAEARVLAINQQGTQTDKP